jgi:hypothetical protein
MVGPKTNWLYLEGNQRKMATSSSRASRRDKKVLKMELMQKKRRILASKTAMSLKYRRWRRPEPTMRQ